MDTGFIEVAERLAAEFAELPSVVVFRALTDVHDEHPAADQMFVEAAARARLSLLRQARLAAEDQRGADRSTHPLGG